MGDFQLSCVHRAVPPEFMHYVIAKAKRSRSRLEGSNRRPARLPASEAQITVPTTIIGGDGTASSAWRSAGAAADSRRHASHLKTSAHPHWEDAEGLCERCSHRKGQGRRDKGQRFPLSLLPFPFKTTSPVSRLPEFRRGKHGGSCPACGGHRRAGPSARSLDSAVARSVTTPGTALHINTVAPMPLPVVTIATW